MKKHVHIRLLTLLLMIISFSTCEKPELLIDQPTIIVYNQSPEEFDELAIRLNEYAEQGGVRTNPEYIQWTVFDSIGDVIKDDFIDSTFITWIPESIGRYQIKAIVGYLDNKSAEASQNIDVGKRNLRISAHIIVENEPPLIPNEELKIYVFERAFHDSRLLLPQSFLWRVQNSTGNIIKDDFGNKTSSISWAAEEAGAYHIYLKIEYDKFTATEINKQIDVRTDFRQQYSGDYHFIRTSYTWTENTGKTWKPTTYYDGYIKPDPETKENIIVKCGDGEFGSWSDHFSIKLYEGNDTLNPRFLSASGHFYVRGDFIGNDSLSFKYGDGGRGGGYGWEIFGKKVE